MKRNVESVKMSMKSKDLKEKYLSLLNKLNFFPSDTVKRVIKIGIKSKMPVNFVAKASPTVRPRIKNLRTIGFSIYFIQR